MMYRSVVGPLTEPPLNRYKYLAPHHPSCVDLISDWRYDSSTRPLKNACTQYIDTSYTYIYLRLKFTVVYSKIYDNNTYANKQQ